MQSDPAEYATAVGFRLVAIAASAGGLPALTEILSHLSNAFPLPVAIVQHVGPDHRSFVAEILGRRTTLRVVEAVEGDELVAGTVYIAAPGSHMEIDARSGCGRIHLGRSEPLHFVRPSADRLFMSAADECSPVLAVILSGSGVDGATGAEAIRRAGGFVIAQDEMSSAVFGMPHAAIARGAVDLVLPLRDIAAALLNLAKVVAS